MSAKLYGTYVSMECDLHASQKEKAGIILQGIQQLFGEIENWDIDLNLNTLKIIVHEGQLINGAETWYESPVETLKGMRYGMTVGVKCEGFEE